MKVKVNNAALASALGIAQGSVVDVPCKNGIPTNREWRNRLKDAKIDNCVSIVEAIPNIPSKKERGGK